MIDLETSHTDDGLIAIEAVQSETGETLQLARKVLYDQATLDEFFGALETEIKQTLFNTIVDKILTLDEDLKFNFIQAEPNQIGIIMLQSIFVEVIEESFEENHVERSFQLTQEEI